MTTQNNTTETEVRMVGKLTIKATGANPKKVHALPEGQNSLTLCRIFGMADGIKQKEDPNSGKVFFPLVGRFVGITPDGNETRSGLLYLPTGIHETYEAAVRELNEKDEGGVIKFAIEIRAVKASNPAGYSYEAVDLMPVRSADPLLEFAHSVEHKQIAASTEAPAEKPSNGKATAKK